MKFKKYKENVGVVWVSARVEEFELAVRVISKGVSYVIIEFGHEI